MNPIYEKLLRCKRAVEERVDSIPDTVLVLGSGLGGFAEEIREPQIVEYGEIPGFPVSTVPGHAGRFIFGKIDDTPLVAMQGRVHYYEGYPLSDVVLPVRLLGALGVKTLFLTNAAGSVDPAYNAGDLMLITDHILTFFPNPLIGENIPELGLRFPDMTQVYDRNLCGIIRAVAKKNGIFLREGVYVQLTGPSFETPAEIRLLGKLGGSAVGMSTACEAVAARHMGMRVCGISCITNKGSGLSEEVLTHEEVQATGDRVAPVFRKLVRDSLTAMTGQKEGAV